MTDTGWTPYLDPDEEILWQGKPAQSVIFTMTSPTRHLMGLFAIGFSVFWMTGAAQAGGSYWMFGLILFLVGLFEAVGIFFWRAFAARSTWYTLTTRRAMIATDMPFLGRQLKTYRIAPTTPLSYLPGSPATIHFAQEERRGSKGRRYMVDIGFERIAEGDKVFGLMRDVQRGPDADAV